MQQIISDKNLPPPIVTANCSPVKRGRFEQDRRRDSSSASGSLGSTPPSQIDADVSKAIENLPAGSCLKLYSFILKFEKKTRAGQLMILKSSKENLKKFD
jgi:hypothetical protein